ncbi:Helix-turn-helix [Paenibacillus algorifonticola]|uniref:Helix-turn-helix n=1 Tax=Paenibacillus algorifonticola TaxID=684063 RepID=A0A1I2AFZ7_9BACL|nr:Helix-turn-helix [Paenibacillus algorifonticola]
MHYSLGKCRLKFHLSERGMTQAEFARRMGYDVRLVSFYATGDRTMPQDVMYSVSRFLGCTMEELYEWDIKRD